MKFEWGDTHFTYDENDEGLNLFTSELVRDFFISFMDINNDNITKRFINQIFLPYLNVEPYRLKRLAYLGETQRLLIADVSKDVERGKKFRKPDNIRQFLTDFGYDRKTNTITEPLHLFIFNHGTTLNDPVLHDLENPTIYMKQFLRFLNELYSRLPEAKDAPALPFVSNSSTSSSSEDSEPRKGKFTLSTHEINFDLQPGEVLFGPMLDKIDKGFVLSAMVEPYEDNEFLKHFHGYIRDSQFRESRQQDLRQLKHKMLEIISNHPEVDWAAKLRYKFVPVANKGLFSMFKRENSYDESIHNINGQSIFYLLMSTGTKGKNAKFHVILKPTRSMKMLFNLLDKQQSAKVNKP